MYRSENLLPFLVCKIWHRAPLILELHLWKALIGLYLWLNFRHKIYICFKVMNRSLKFTVPRGCRSDLKNSKNPTEYVSPNRFNCLNNYRQFENDVDFNKEIAHVISSNILTTSKGSTDISQSKERSKEPIRGRKIKTNRPNAPTTTIIGDSLVRNYQDNSTINTML